MTDSRYRIVLVQGANMEWLGIRQPEYYGTTTAAELDGIIAGYAKTRNVDLEMFYTNYEGEAISRLYEAARRGIDGILMNPAGFMLHGSGLKDCLVGIGAPYIEVHMTNVEKRGRRSILASVADGMVAGFGIESYTLGLDALISVIRQRRAAAA